MESQTLGKVKMTPRGEYREETTYVPLDIVSYGGGSYCVLKNVTGITPAGDDVNYQLLAESGADGKSPQISENKTWLVWDAEAGEYVDTGVSAAGEIPEVDDTLTQSGKAADAKAVGDALAGKQDTISDLEAIRNGAAKGTTALQSVPSTYRTASEQDTIDDGKVDKVTGKGLSSNDYTDAAKAKVDALAPVATSGSYNDLTNKPTIPTALPNPNALTFTGAVEGSYDGSAPLSVEIPSGGGTSTDGGVGTGAYEFSVLSSGTIPANTITAAEIGNGMIDTGITLGMLRQYKVFNMLYRCDSGNQYYAFSVGNPGEPLDRHRRFIYDTYNAMNATILWIDSARTAVLMLCGIGNSKVISPANVERMGSFGNGELCSSGDAMASINAYGNLADFTDESKIYVGVMHMNGQATNTKDFTWAICGVIK